MHWKKKAFIQNLVSKLPERLSYGAYYFLQRRFGGLKVIDPSEHFHAAAKVLEILRERGQPPGTASFLEVGTGRRIALPIGLWLCGAGRCITVDLNPYLKAELIWEDIEYVRDHESAVAEALHLCAATGDFSERVRRLADVEGDLPGLLKLMNLDYQAPADATALDIAAESVDYHIAFTVCEHIPPDVLAALLQEGKRVLKRDGLFIHSLDLSDHFSHLDEAISSVNFLQFTDRQWERYAGNRYMYHNRLRVDDVRRLFEQAGLEILLLRTHVDERALAQLRGGFRVDARFRDKPDEVNATRGAWIIARKRDE